MTKLLAGARCLSSIVLASSALAGCAGDGSGDGAPPAPPPVAEPAAPGAHVVVGSYVAHMRPRENRIDLTRIRKEVDGVRGDQLAAQGLTNASIVSNSVPGSGPNYTVELDTTGTTDTFGSSMAVGSCPAGAFCGDVQFTHFYPGLNLSAVYAQITGISNGTTLIHNHNAKNGVSSTPFGLDLTYGAWSYTASMATVASGAPVTTTWAFANPDDSDFYVYLNVYAALYPMLWFDTTGNGGVTQSAPLAAGQPAIVHYMYARNSACRGAGWSMQGYLKGSNIDIHTTSWPGVSTDTYFDQQVIVPFSSGADFWFNNTDSSSCNNYDSNGGHNFNFGISNVSPTLHFAGPSASTSPYSTTNWAWGSDSALHGAMTVSVDYELDRVVCGLDRYGRVPAGTTVKMYTSFDNGAFDAGVSLIGLPYDVPSAINGASGQVYVPPTITIPSGSHKTSIYFDSTNGTGCHNYDSGGSNFNFNY